MYEVNRLLYNEVRKSAKTLAEASQLMKISNAATRHLLGGEHQVSEITWRMIEPQLPGLKNLLHFPKKEVYGPRLAKLTDAGIAEYNKRQINGALPLFWEDPLYPNPRGKGQQRRYCERMRKQAQKVTPSNKDVTTTKKPAIDKPTSTKPIEVDIGAGKEKIKAAGGGKVAKGIGYCGALLARLVRIPGMREDITMLDETLRNDGSSIAEALKMIP